MTYRAPGIYLHLIVISFIVYSSQKTVAGQPHMHLTIAVSLLQDENSQHNKDLKFISLHCGMGAISKDVANTTAGRNIQRDKSHVMAESDDNDFAGDDNNGQLYLQLNDSEINPNSTYLIDYNITSGHGGGNLIATFYISQTEQFIGKFTCVYESTKSNITNNLLLVYMPASLLNVTYLVFFIVACIVCTIMLMLLSTIWCAYNSQFKCARKRQIMASSSEIYLPYEQIRPHCTHNHLSCSCDAESSQQSRKGHHSTPLTEVPVVAGISEEAANELLQYLSHPSPCQAVHCPCTYYKQKLINSLKFTLMHRSSCRSTPTMNAVVSQGSPLHLSSRGRDETTRSAPCLVDAESEQGRSHASMVSNFYGSPQQPITTTAINNCKLTLRSLQSESLAACSASLKPFDPVETVTFDSNGGRYSNENHEIFLRVPKGAIPKGKTISIEVGVSLHSSLVSLLPQRTKPVSPLVKFCVIGEENFRFLKPVEVTLPHFMDIADEGDVNRMSLQFMKAGHNPRSFCQSDGIASFMPGSNTATLVTEHFCTFCIAANSNMLSTEKINYRLVKVVPKNRDQQWRANFCVSYYLRTCLQVLSTISSKGYRPKMFIACSYVYY